LASWGFIFANIGITFAIFTFTFIIGIINAKGSIGEATVQGLAGAYGNIMMTISGLKKQSTLQLVFEILKKIIFHPFIMATAVGVLAASISFTPPLPIERLIDYLAQAAAPCALFAMGVTLALRPLNRMPWSLGYIVPIKLIIHPLLMYVGLSYAGNFDTKWMFTAILLASLPTATNVFVIAQQYNVWVERASASVLVTTSLSVITVSVLLYGITTGVIPADLFP